LKAPLIACAVDINAAATQGIDEADLVVARRVIAQMIESLDAGSKETRS
jgi:hypothetical protein